MVATHSENINLLIQTNRYIIFSKEYASSLDKDILTDKCLIAQAIITSVHQLEIGQGDTENWKIQLTV